MPIASAALLLFFIPVCDPHFVYNLRVPTCSSQACCLTILFSFFFWLFSSFLFLLSDLFSFFSLLNIIFFPSAYYEPKTMSTVSQKHSDAHPSQSSPTFPAYLACSCDTVSNTKTGTY